MVIPLPVSKSLIRSRCFLGMGRRLSSTVSSKRNSSALSSSTRNGSNDGSMFMLFLPFFSKMIRTPNSAILKLLISRVGIYLLRVRLCRVVPVHATVYSCSLMGTKKKSVFERSFTVYFPPWVYLLRSLAYFFSAALRFRANTVVQV